MKKLILFFAINCLIFSLTQAQDVVFSVILNKGENSFGQLNSFQPILIGSSLHKNDILNVSEGGYIALVHEETGASLELKSKGRYNIAELEQDVKDQNSTVLAKYGKFLMSKLNPEDLGNQNLNVTGAVERGDISMIRVNLPKVIDVYGSHIYISWHQVDDVQKYTLTVKDKLDDVIVEKQVTGMHYFLDLEKDGLADEKLIILNVRAREIEDLRSPDFGIKRLSEKERKSIGKEYAHIKKAVNAETALDKLFIASFFEENQLLGDAITYYNEALEISPDPDGFSLLYDNFLARNGLKN